MYQLLFKVLHMNELISFSHQPYEVLTCIVPNLQVRKLKKFAQSALFQRPRFSSLGALAQEVSSRALFCSSQGQALVRTVPLRACLCSLGLQGRLPGLRANVPLLSCPWCCLSMLLKVLAACVRPEPSFSFCFRSTVHLV